MTLGAGGPALHWRVTANLTRRRAVAELSSVGCERPCRSCGRALPKCRKPSHARWVAEYDGVKPPRDALGQ